MKYRCASSSLHVCFVPGLCGLLLFVCGASAAESPAWNEFPGYREAPLTVPVQGRSGFHLMPETTTGIGWTNRMSPARMQQRQNLMNGSGVAAGDYDGDGLCDLYFCSTAGPNVLYRNLGNWNFEDVTSFAGVDCGGQSSTGALFGDINGDGKLDLLVSSFTGADACFLNMGGGRFTNITARAGLTSRGGTTSMALGDLDGDGDLDLYVCHFAVEAILRDGADFAVQMVGGRPVVSGRYARRLKIVGGKLVEFGDPDVVYRNEGGGRFTRLKWEEWFTDENGDPMSPPLDFGLSVQIRDLNGDRLPDIFVCNDFQTPDRIWLNKGDGKFGALKPSGMRRMSFASMGADFADVDRDGRLDMFVVEMLSRDHGRHLRQSSPMVGLPALPGRIEGRDEVARNTLFWNRGDGTYSEIAWFSGLAASDWSWTPAFMDVDLDGYEDLLVTNGHLHDVNDRDVNERRRMRPPGGPRGNPLSEYPRLETPNAAFRNQGNLTFADIGKEWRFDSTKVSYGMALADLDNDGDQDVAINCANESPLIYRNETVAPRIAVRLKGNSPNVQGIGALIHVSGGPVTQTQEIVSGGRYLSGDDPMRVFAAGATTNRMRIEVVWRRGARTVVEDARPNRIYEFAERVGGDVASPAAEQTPRLTGSALFEDVSAMLGHAHVEDHWDDFEQQPLLPRRISRLGPGIAWFDLDADGWDDLVIGGARGGTFGCFRNVGGRLTPLPALAGNVLPEDTTALTGWIDERGVPCLLAGMLGQSGSNSGNAVVRLSYQGRGAWKVSDLLARGTAGIGPLAVADIDGDGDLDLFVGGRFIPGRYPEPADSRLLRNEGGRLVEDPEAARLFRGIGLVSGACFSDLDGDGFSELVLACEWGPVRLFQNAGGTFRERTVEWELDRHLGLWTSVQSGDFDGDGRMDLIAGNWGSNSFYQRAGNGPWHLYYGELNSDRRVHTIEAYSNANLQKIVPFRDLETLGTVLPWVRGNIQSHEKYAGASMLELFGERSSQTRQLSATTVESMLFLNRGDRFEARALPAPAQWSPVFGVAVADFNGDSNDDLFIGQNFSSVRPEDERQLEGRGLILAGDGSGGFKSLLSSESGIELAGDQRGVAIADFDHDGRADIAVGQSDGPTRVFRNREASPGVRVRLRGPAQNPFGIGSMIRLESGGKPGPAREIHGGGGYWSQDSPVTVMSAPGAVSAVWVRWPGGKTTRTPVTPGAREIDVVWLGE